MSLGMLVYVVYQLVCSDFPLCILLNHFIALFVQLHAAYLSVHLATGGSFHSIAFSSRACFCCHLCISCSYISISLSVVVQLTPLVIILSSCVLFVYK